MTQTLGTTPERAEQVPQYFEPDLIVSPPENPVYTPQMVADLTLAIKRDRQLTPGFLAPAGPEFPEGKLLCLEGNRRLEVCRILGIKFWAFKLSRFMPEAERIEFTFSHNFLRRRMSRDEIVERASRYLDLTHCTQEEAAKALNVSPPTLSRAFGEKRILSELRSRTALLGPSIRSLIASVPGPLQAKVLAFAEASDASGKKKTRDQVSSFIAQVRKGDGPKSRKLKPITLTVGARVLTLTLAENDSASSVIEDLKTIAARLGRHPEVEPQGWSYLFR